VTLAANYAGDRVVGADARLGSLPESSSMAETIADRRFETEDETGDMVVVTVALPDDRREIPAVWAREHTVVVTASGGYRHEVALSPEADMERLHAQLFGRYLELRAPRGPEPAERPVPVYVIRAPTGR
jgi:hypothetical protein